MANQTQFYAVEKDGQYINSSGQSSSQPQMTTSSQEYAQEIADRTGGKVAKV